MDNKNILLDENAYSPLKKGIDKVANAVKVTLGYAGRTVIISEPGMPPRTTKDGVTVAKHIKLANEEEDAGAKYVIDVADKTVQQVGDGTTTITILLQALVEQGVKQIAAGANAVDVKRGMDKACEVVVKELEKQRIDINEKLLMDAASVSANNDKEIGKIISEAYQKLGKHANISIEDSMSEKTYVEPIDGFQFECGYLIHHFVNNHAKNTCELENPYVLMAEGKINDPNEIWDLLEAAAKEGRPILLLAEDFDRSVIQNLLNNYEKLKSCAIKYNFSGDTKQELMYDLCAMTGATLAEKKGDKLSKLKKEYLGQCEKIIVSDKETLIVRGKSDQALIEARKADAQAKIDAASHPFMKQKHERRMAKLSGCLAVCYVGGITDVETSEKKDRVEDSIKATKAAAEGGVLPGSGTALLRCITAVKNMNKDNDGEIAGTKVVIEALGSPSFQICENAGIENPAGMVSDVKNRQGNYGYNVATGQIEDLVESGIVDPFKVVKACIENAVSAAGQLIVSKVLIVSENKTQ